MEQARNINDVKTKSHHWHLLLTLHLSHQDGRIEQPAVIIGLDGSHRGLLSVFKRHSQIVQLKVGAAELCIGMAESKRQYEDSNNRNP